MFWDREHLDPWPRTGCMNQQKFQTQKEENRRRVILCIWSKPSQTFWQELLQWPKNLFQTFFGWSYSFCQAKRNILRVWFQIDDWDWWRLILLSLEIVYNSQNMMMVFVLHGNNYTSNTIKVQWLSHHNSFPLITAW